MQAVVLYRWSHIDNVLEEAIYFEDWTQPVPAYTTTQEPPEVTGLGVPQWTGEGWIILPERPKPPKLTSEEV